MSTNFSVKWQRSLRTRVPSLRTTHYDP